MRLITWNVNGIRAGMKKGFEEKLSQLQPDIMCLQETKAQDDQVMEALAPISGYHIYCNSAERKGYSGTAILSKTEPIKVEPDIQIAEHDTEGRVLQAEYEDFHLVNVYVPNSGGQLKRLDYRGEWDIAFAEYLKNLTLNKPVILTGDLNVAHQPIDLSRPDENYNKTAGYTQVEIDGFNRFLDIDLRDIYRERYPDKQEFTFWNQRFKARERNVGWRIDYFLISSSLVDSVEDVAILGDVMGSDHCPVLLKLK
ncbi:exodeoxyribonuclease III [Membranihabitans marinus]|uniref:exodeoxyribonuclease III n=1 Tax=Membranihabitans marinus TaxID=1227546 RepID=UPI001F191995|nr:exodeoxyribonuclease III [Membranihabitans marinus]